MKCPNCGSTVRKGLDVCPACGYSVVKPEEQLDQSQQKTKSRWSLLANALVVVLLGLITIGFFGLILYNGYFWFDNWRINRVYTAGQMTPPDIEPITLADGRVGHALSFYGRDGDELFIPQLGRTYMFSGGFTRIEVPDSQWFDLNPDETESAIVTMYPMIFQEGGDITRLPALEMEVQTPVSPLEMLNPTEDRTDVITSVFPLQIKVVPKSKVLISGEDVTDVVSNEGILSKNINVFPLGDNNISIYVDTPNHRQTRRDIVLYRGKQSINLEPSANLNKKTNKKYHTISGSSEPGATIVVDSKYAEASLKTNAAGNYTFQAEMSKVGNNTVTFHATMAGREDTFISVDIYYVPGLNEYSRSAWPINYEELQLMADTGKWDGKVFLCKGVVTEVIEGTNPQAFVLNIAPEGSETEQNLILVNDSNVGTPEIGKQYNQIYADLTGSEFYGKERAPKLIARYILG